MRLKVETDPLVPGPPGTGVCAQTERNQHDVVLVGNIAKKGSFTIVLPNPAKSRQRVSDGRRS
jgi:hypothetical protein